jgi:hypothetical protein
MIICAAKAGFMKLNRRSICSVILASMASVPAFADNASSYLLLTINKLNYSNGPSPQSQKYKVLLDSGFLSQFKNQPTATSAGTEFYCAISDGSMSTPGISFTLWFAPQAGGKVSTWFWGEGDESINGAMIDAHNGTAQVSANFPSWQTIDTGETMTFSNDNANTQTVGGINVGFSVQSVAAGDPSLSGALLAPVNAADNSSLVAGDSQNGVTLTASCAFQNN